MLFFFLFKLEDVNNEERFSTSTRVTPEETQSNSSDLLILFGIIMPLCVVLLLAICGIYIYKRQHPPVRELIEMSVFDGRDLDETPSPRRPPERPPLPHRYIDPPSALYIDVVPQPDIDPPPALDIDDVPPPDVDQPPALDMDGVPHPDIDPPPVLDMDGVPHPDIHPPPVLDMDDVPQPDIDPPQGQDGNGSPVAIECNVVIRRTRSGKEF